MSRHKHEARNSLYKPTQPFATNQNSFPTIQINLKPTKMPMQNTTVTYPHVLIFPLPLQGAINSMLKLAELLSVSDINITFLVTDHIHSGLLRHTNVISRFKKYPGFVLHSISDGLPEEHPRSGARYMEMFDSMKFNSKSLLKDLLSCGRLEHGGRGPVTCIIADGLMSFVCDVANEVGISIFYIRTLSPCSLSVFFSLPKIIQAGELPFTTGMSFSYCFFPYLILYLANKLY